MKICSKCGVERVLSDFRERSDGYISGQCRRCVNEYHRTYKGKARVDARARSKYDSHNKRFVREYKVANPFCADCGLAHPFWRLDFDHLPGNLKKFGLSSGGLSRPLKSIIEEIAKCELVCANCHRDRTYKRMMLTRFGKRGEV